MKKQTVYVSLLLGLCSGMFGMAFHAKQAEAKKYTENDITYSINNGEAKVYDCKTKEESITIPSKVNGYKVTEIGRYAFLNSKLKKIQIPDTVEKIAVGAFQNCDNLTSISLPDKVRILETSTFLGCAKLKKVQLSEKTTQISSYAFYQCISLKSVSLPEGLKHIGDNAFEKCYKLSGVKFGSELDVIGERAFYKNYKMTSIKIPEGVTSVGFRAFYNCKNLKKVVFQGKKTSVSVGMFQKCTSLKKIKLPEKIKAIPKYFLAETGLKTFKIPENVTVIRSNSFKRCEKLKKVVMNKKLYAIEDGVFRQSGLKTIQFNKNMQFIGNGAFRGTNVKKISLPDNLEYIGNRVFADCQQLYEITIPKSVRGINPGAFNHCTSLKKITVDIGNAYYSSKDGVFYDKAKTKLLQYPLNKRNQTFTVPNSVRIVRAHAFEGNPYLKELSVGAKTIGYRAFASMEQLKKVTLQRGVEKIKESAFREDKKLQTCVMADSVREIGERAFSGSSLVSLKIPRYLKKIGRDAFWQCYDLTEFTGGGNYYKVKDGVLYSEKGTLLLEYPAKKNAVKFTVPDQVTRLDSSAFDHVKKLEKLYFGRKIKELPSGCISSCGKLRSIVFDSRTKLEDGTYAVSGCKSLAAIVGPKHWILIEMAEHAETTMIIL